MITTIRRMTIPSTDNGENFVCKDRIVLIKEDLTMSSYACLGELPLAIIYQHTNFNPQEPAALISAHIDSIYEQFHVKTENDMLIGTLDNSACNGITVALMRDNKFHPQVLVAFTGNEESDMKGVDQVMEILQQEGLLGNIEFVFVLDLTEEGFPDDSFTFENLFLKKDDDGSSLLKFSRSRDMMSYLKRFSDNPKPIFIANAEEDEAWRYDDYNLNCVSICLPCQPIDGDMHSDIGVKIAVQAASGYTDFLPALVSGVAKDLSNQRRLHKKK